MISIQKFTNSRFWNQLQYLALRPSTNASSLQLICLISEVFFFTCFISSKFIQFQTITNTFDSTFFILVLLALIGLRRILGLTFGKIMYVPCAILTLSINLNGLNELCQFIVLLIFLLTILAIDVISHIQYNFCTENVFSQSLNFNKILHYFTTLLAIFFRVRSDLIFAQNKIWIQQLICLLVFLLVSITKSISNYKNPVAKQWISRFYLISIGFYAKNIINYFQSDRIKTILSDSLQIFIVIISSQIVYVLVSRFVEKLNPQAEISKGNITKLVFSMLSYHFSTYFNQEIEDAIDNLFSKNQKFQQQFGVMRNADEQSKYAYSRALKMNRKSRRHQNLKRQKDLISKASMPLIEQLNRIQNMKKIGLGLKMQAILKQAEKQSTSDEFQIKILMACIQLHILSNPIKCKHILQTLRQQHFKCRFIKLICLYKLNRKVEEKLAEKNQNPAHSHPEYDHFFENQKFRILLVKHSQQYLALWKYAGNLNLQEILFSKLGKLVNFILAKQSKVQEMYLSLQVKCSSIISIYAQYLYHVQRDVERAFKTYRQLNLFKQNQHFLNIDKKIYFLLQLHLECHDLGQQLSCPLRIVSSGQNCKTLLSYPVPFLKNKPISILIPDFYTNYHNRILKQAIESQQGNNMLYVFRKQVIVKKGGEPCLDGIKNTTKSNPEFYVPAKLDFRLKYRHYFVQSDSRKQSGQNGLVMQGYIQVLEDEIVDYQWNNYFWVKEQDNQLIEVGPMLKHSIQISNSKFINVLDYFSIEKQSSKESIQSQVLSSFFSKSPQQQAKNSRKNQQIDQPTKAYYLKINSQYKYSLYRIFASKKTRFLYYVCCKNQLQNCHMATGNEHCRQATNQKYQKFYLPATNNSIKQFFAKKQSLIESLNSRAPVVAFIIFILIMLALFTMQFVLITRVQVARQQNENIMTDLNNLMQFYHNLQNIGVNLKKYIFLFEKGIFFSYEYFNMTYLMLDVQKYSQLVSKFDRNKYPLSPPVFPPNTPDLVINSPRSMHLLISELNAQFYPFLYVVDDQLVNIYRQKMKTLYTYIWGSSLSDYLVMCMEQVSKVSLIDTKIKMSVSVILTVGVLIGYILVIYIQNKRRKKQYQVLQAISNIHSLDFIKGCQTFLILYGQFFEQDICQEQIKGSYQNFMVQNSKTGDLQIGPSSSGRDHSSRPFQASGIQNNYLMQNRLGQSQISRQIFQRGLTLPQNTLEFKQKVELDHELRKENKVRPISKLFIVIWTFFLIVILVVIASNSVMDYRRSKISIFNSLKSLITLLNRQLLYSSAAICYLDRVSNNSMQASLFYQNYKKYFQLEPQQTPFPQLYHPEFRPFTESYQNFSFTYLCEYMNCEQKYKPKLEMKYSSLIMKTLNFMKQNLALPRSSPQFMPQIQFIFYSHYLLEQTFNKLLSSYLQCYKQFDETGRTILIKLYWVTVGLGIVHTLLGIYWGLYEQRVQNQKMKTILQFIKENSYRMNQGGDNQEEQIDQIDARYAN